MENQLSFLNLYRFPDGESGLEAIKLEFILKLKVKRIDWPLEDTCPQTCDISVLWLFLMVPWVGLQCVIVVFPDHIHLLFF